MISKKEDIEVGKNFNDDYVISKIFPFETFYDLQLIEKNTGNFGSVRIMKLDLTKI